MIQSRLFPIADFNPRIHDRKQVAKAMMGAMLSAVPGGELPRDDLLVVNFHSTPRKFMRNFEQLVDHLLTRFQPLCPDALDSYREGHLQAQSKPFILFTFDDGLENQLYAAEALESRGVFAVFFVVPAFIEGDKSSQSRYYTTHMRSRINPHIDSEPEDLTAMSWAQLRDLHRAGHEIGSHTYTHTIRVGTVDETQRVREIVTSQEVIAKHLAIEPAAVRSMCGPVNPLLSIGVDEMDLIKKHYRYFYTVFAGSNRRLEHPFAIRRVNMESYWMHFAARFGTYRWEWYRWQGRAARFDSEVVERSVV